MNKLSEIKRDENGRAYVEMTIDGLTGIYYAGTDDEKLIKMFYEDLKRTFERYAK